LAPAAVQPLKPDGAAASFHDRLRMVELLCDGARGLEASALDGPQPGGKANYTIDTLKRLRSELPAEAELFVIVGADAFLELRKWRNPDDLLREARWIVVSRPGFDLRRIDAMGLSAEQRARVETLADFDNPVSATEVRERLHDREEAAELVPPKVLEYIRAHHLYGE
jgi:nicotinate-nucleotide adenylyltransferase